MFVYLSGSTTWYIVELTILREKFTKWYSGKINNSLFNNQFNPIKQIYLSGTLYSDRES